MHIQIEDRLLTRTGRFCVARPLVQCTGAAVPGFVESLVDVIEIGAGEPARNSSIAVIT